MKITNLHHHHLHHHQRNYLSSSSFRSIFSSSSFFTLFLISSSLLPHFASALSNNSSITLKVAVLQPFGRADDAWNWSYAAGFEMIQQAFEDARTVLPLADFQAIRYDSYSGEEDEGTDAATSVFRVLDAIKDGGVVAVIGDATSDASMQSSLLTGNFKIPQCSFSSGSPYLSKKSTYPYFFRTLGSSATDAANAMKLAKILDWTYVGIVYTDNAIGRGALEQANIDAKTLGITVNAITSLAFGTDVNATSIRWGIDLFVQKDIRIILLLGTSEELANFYITARLEGKLTGENYAYIAINNLDEGFISYLSDQDGHYDESVLYDWSSNILYVSQGGDGDDTPWYQIYHDEFTDPNVTAKYPLIAYDTWNKNQAYTCAWMIVHGFKSLVDEFKDERGVLQNISHRTMGEYLRPPRFSTGKLSPIGPMLLDINGDFISLGEIYSNASSLKSLILFSNGSHVQVNDLIYYRGSKVKPLDRPEMLNGNITVKDAQFQLLAIISGIMIICVLIMMGLIWRYREMKIVKNTSPVSNILVLFGMLVTYSSVFVGVGIPSSAMCMGNIYMIALGFAVIFSNLLGKAWRLSRIFNNKLIRIQGITNKYLLTWSAFIVLIDLIILVVWSATNPLTAENTVLSPIKYTVICVQGTAASPTFTVLLFGFNGLLILLGIYLSFITRNVSRNFSDQYIPIAIYNIALLSFIAIPLLYISEIYQSYQYFLRQLLVFLATTGTFASLFLPILIRMWPVINGAKSEADANKVTQSVFPGTNMNLFANAVLNEDMGTEAHSSNPEKSLAKKALKPSYIFNLTILIKSRTALFQPILSSWKNHIVLIQKTANTALSFLLIIPAGAADNEGNTTGTDFKQAKIYPLDAFVEIKLMADEMAKINKVPEKAQKLQIVLVFGDLQLILQTKSDPELALVKNLLMESVSPSLESTPGESYQTSVRRGENVRSFVDSGSAPVRPASMIVPLK